MLLLPAFFLHNIKRGEDREAAARQWTDAYALLLFAGSILGQWFAGWHVAREDALPHHQAVMTLGTYTTSPEFISSVFENWESEFLQMSAYVVLTARLVQRGSSKSKDP